MAQAADTNLMTARMTYFQYEHDVDMPSWRRHGQAA